MYLFFKQDGSIEKSIINEYVMQGSSGVNYIYVYFTGRARATYLATAFVTLPNTDVIELAMSDNTFTYDGVEYAGYRVALDGSCTSQAGEISINVVLTDVDLNQLATYTFSKTVNETSVSPTSEISYAQYMALISMIFTMKSYNLGILTSLDSLDTEMVLGTYTFNYLDQAYYMFISKDGDDNIIQTYITATAGAIVIKSREYDIVTETWGEWSTAQESYLIDATATTITSRAQLASVVSEQYKLYMIKMEIESDADFSSLSGYSAFLGENNYITLCGAGTIYMVDSSPTYSTFRRSASKAELTAEVTKITNGTTIALKASQDDEGHDIVDTYATKTALSAKVPQTRTILGIDLADDILLGAFKSAIGEAIEGVSGLMSATDKARLDALHALLGVEADADAVVNTINEVLAIFNAYPEGADLLNALAGKVDKVAGKGLSKNDFTDALKAKLDSLLNGASYYNKEYIDALKDLNGWSSALLTETALTNGGVITKATLSDYDVIKLFVIKTATGEIDTDSFDTSIGLVDNYKYVFFDNADIYLSIANPNCTFTDNITGYQLKIIGQKYEAQEAENVNYDNTVKNLLVATNVQDAIDEISIRDTSLSFTSANPVQNKVITNALGTKANNISLTNLFENGNFASGELAPFITNGVSVDVSISLLVATMSTPNQYSGIRISKNVKAGHTYLYMVKVVNKSSGTYNLWANGDGGLFQTGFSQNGTNFIKTLTFEATGTGTQTFYFTDQLGNSSIQFTNWMLFDLTDSYGEDTPAINDILDTIDALGGYIDGTVVVKTLVDLINEKSGQFENEVYKLLPEELEYGYITGGNGILSYATSYTSTDYIQVRGTKVSIYTGFRDAAGFAFYDKNKVYISGVDGSQISSQLDTYVDFDVPENAVYVRTCRINMTPSSPKSDFAVYVKSGFYSILDKYELKDENPCDYQGCACRTFKKILCIGDSLTAGTFDYRDGGSSLQYFVDASLSYPTFLKAITGRDTTNLGMGGYNTQQWYNYYQNEDLSGYDCAIIELGLNDYAGSVQINLDQAEAALRNIIAKLKNENNGIKIFVSSILPCYKSTNAANHNARFKSVCDDENLTDVYYLDIYNYGNTYANSGYHKGHLTAIGYNRLAQDYYNYVSYIIENNANDFAFIQYIGTNHTYN